MSDKEDKPVGSEFPPPPPVPLKDERYAGAEFPPSIDTSPPPAYPGPSGNSSSQQQQLLQQQLLQQQLLQQQLSQQQLSQQPYLGNQQNQQTFSPYSPYSPHSQYSSHSSPYSTITGNQYELNNRSLPPQQGYVQPQQPQQTYVVQHQMQPYQPQIHLVNVGASTAGSQIFSHTPVRTTCPHCNNEITTIVIETPGSTAYLWSLVLCCVFFPLMWLPCVLSGCLDKTHSCPVCRNVLAYIKV